MSLNKNISVTILLKGFPRHLHRVLGALETFDEILLYDNGASKEALDICHRFSNAKVVQGPFLGFGKTHNKASALASHDWILSVDSDEVVSKELALEIGSLKLDSHCVYSIPRHNEYNGKWIRWCGWYPDRVVRLYDRNTTSFSNSQVHEKVKKDRLQEVCLKMPLIHFSYENISDFLSKMQSYSELFAVEHTGKKSSSPLKALLHGFGAFLKSYFLKLGILDGYEGFLISSYNAHTAFYKYLKLYEANLILAKMRRCPDENGYLSSSINETQK